MNIAKVWPLCPGLAGTTPEGHRIQLQPGVAGFMEYATAVEAEKRGEVQLMAGQTPQSLKTPNYDDRSLSSGETSSAAPMRKKKVYARRDMVAEKPGS